MNEKKGRADTSLVSAPDNNSIVKKLIDASIDAHELETAETLHIDEILSPFIFAGVNVIAGEPRSGKTWLILQLLKEIKDNTVLYYSEDSLAILQKRIRYIHIPKGRITIISDSKIEEIPTITDLMQTALEMKKDILVIDTMMLIMPSRHDPDYTEIGTFIRNIKKNMHKYNIKAIILTHHTRKKPAATQKTASELTFDDIHGSQGLRAAADSVSIIQTYSAVGNTHQTYIMTEKKVQDTGTTKYIIETNNYNIVNIKEANVIIEQNTESIVMHYIDRMHETGESTTPKNIIQAVRTDQPEIKENTIRVALSRLRQAGKVEKKGTQYIPADASVDIEDDEI